MQEKFITELYWQQTEIRMTEACSPKQQWLLVINFLLVYVTYCTLKTLMSVVKYSHQFVKRDRTQSS